MKNTKKVLSIALAGALAFGSMGAAFAAEVAATPATTTAAPVAAKTDAKTTEAIKRLTAFGIVAGMEDGKYHEEQKVTREQFAKVIVEALGLGNAANAAKGATKFADVKSDRWSAGYVNVAAGQGLLKGYADGTFKPEAEVSYAEAVTMLVRALGYKDQFLPGSWPGNYVAKAADTKITSGASFNDATGKADRGTVAVLVDNTLDAKVVKVSEYTDGTVKYAESNKTLLKDKLEISKYENVRITADKLVDDSLKSGEVRVDFTKDMDVDQAANAKNTYKVSDSGKTLDILANSNVRTAMGEEATIYTNKDNKIMYTAKANNDKVSFEYVTEDKGNNGMFLYKLDKEYPFDKDAKVYVYNSSNQKYSLAKLDSNNRLSATDAANVLYHSGKFVVKNNKIIYAEMLSGNEAAPWLLVKENKGDILTGINDTNKKYSLNLVKSGNKFGNYDGVMVYDQNGNKMEIKDIQAGNLVYVQKQEIDKDKYAVLTVVSNNVVKGKLDKVKTDTITVAGKDYDIAPKSIDGKTFSAYYSIDKDENVRSWSPAKQDWKDDMKDADAANVTAYLDGAGQVVYMTTEAKAASGYIYGVVTNTYMDNDRVKVYVANKDGKGDEIVYTAEKTRSLESPRKVNDAGQAMAKTDIFTTPISGTTSALYAGAVVKFKLNKKGEIAEEQFFMVDKTKVYSMNTNSDFGKDTIPSLIAGGTTKTTFNVDANTPLIDAKYLTTGNTKASMNDPAHIVKVSDDFGIAKWTNLAEDKYDGTLKYYVFADDTNSIDAKAVVFVGPGASSSNDAEAIYVIDAYTKSGDDYVKYSNSKGEELEKKVNNAPSRIETKEGYIAKIKSDGNIELLAADPKRDLTKMSGYVANRDGDIVTLQTTNSTSSQKQYKLSDKTVVYEKKDKRSISNISKGDYVTFVVENDVNVRVAERLVDGTDDKDKAVAAVNGTTPNVNPGTSTVSGVVTYINATNIAIDNVVSTFDANTVVYDQTGKVIATGGSAALFALTGVDTVQDVVVSGGIVKSVKIKTVAQTEANAVIAKIHAFTLTGTQAEVTAARTAYDALTTAAKAIVALDTTDNTAKLVTGENTLLVAAVVAKIDAFSTPATQAQVTAARTAYDALTPAAKLLVAVPKGTLLTTAEAKLAAADTDAKITALPAVGAITLADKANVVAARAAFNNLTTAQVTQLTVANVTKLTTAESAMTDLDAAAVKVQVAKDALTTLVLSGVSNNVIATPSNHVNGSIYSLALGTIPTMANSGAATLSTGSITMVKDTVAGFTFDVTVTITAVQQAGTAADETTVTATKVFTVTVPYTVAPITVVAK